MSLCLSFLTWKRQNGFRRTLETYRDNGLLDYADEKIAFFQEIQDSDKTFENDFGITVIGNKNNIGIGRAFLELASVSKSDLVLFLEDDFRLIEPLTVVEQQLGLAKVLLDKRVVQVVKFRHKETPGEPLYTHGRIIPTHLLDCIHFMDTPPPEVQRGIYNGVEYWWTTSEHGNYSNNPSCWNKETFINIVGPFCTGNGVELEGKIQPWWEKQQSIRIAQTRGLFTHTR